MAVDPMSANREPTHKGTANAFDPSRALNIRCNAECPDPSAIRQYAHGHPLGNVRRPRPDIMSGAWCAISADIGLFRRCSEHVNIGRRSDR
jgi:hypothetical protein